MSKFIIAIDLGGTSAKMGVLNDNAEIIDRWSVETDISQEGTLIVPNIIQSIHGFLNRENISIDDIKGIGLGTPGTINHEEGTVVSAYNLNWRTVQHVRDQFQEAFPVPFFMDNDANVAALGEQWQGAGEQADNVVMVTLGTGVGGGVVIDGQLVHGINQAAGEIGHMTIEFHDPIDCTCGKKGCLETVASATGAVNLATKHINDFSGQSELKSMVERGDEVSAYSIFQKAEEEQDEYALYIVDLYVDYLGRALSHIANTLNPANIIIGGGVSGSGEFLRSRVEKYFKEYSFSQIRETSKVVIAKLGNDAGMFGAAQIVNNGLNK